MIEEGATAANPAARAKGTVRPSLKGKTGKTTSNSIRRRKTQREKGTAKSCKKRITKKAHQTQSK
jgi:hypothetical protein